MQLLLFVLFATSAFAQPEQRAIDYLAREVPRWSAENHCFSCHNNGDAARALYTAARLGYKVPPNALADTTRWLLQPAKWDENRGNPAFSDKKLARIQFTAALAEFPDARAAESLLPLQAADGSWPVAEASIGSPATWGTPLATYMARTVLEKASAAKFSKPIAPANEWFRTFTPETVFDAAVKTLAGTPLLDLILPAQTSDGGWGPRLHAPAEPFDTAIVLLALRDIESARAAVGRGRKYLIATQLASGGWTETTRPAGASSYAQHISTTAWATLALLLTNPQR